VLPGRQTLQAPKSLLAIQEAAAGNYYFSFIGRVDKKVNGIL
jgi:hypothetical protein